MLVRRGLWAGGASGKSGISKRKWVSAPKHSRRSLVASTTVARVRRDTSLNQGWEFSCSAWQQQPSKLGFSQLEWHPATVPGHVHLDLIDRGIIGNPFERLQELGCQWVDEQDWHYRSRFEFAPDPTLPKRLLRFEGLDTVCRIELNGKSIATHDNMFVALELDVTEVLLPGMNELQVVFEPAARVGRKRQQQYYAREHLPPTTVRFEPRSFVRKAQYMFGWDWGPCLISAGIWRPVVLVEYASRLLDVVVCQRHRADGSVDLEFQSRVEGAGRAYHFVEGFDAPVEDGETLRIAQPRLWWPRGMGASELYRVTSLLAPEIPRASDDSMHVFDRREQRIGLRVLELRREPDPQGESFRFSVHGQELYALGANWIPDDSFPSRVDRARLLRQLAAACDLGMNMLRVWGGGLFESDDFYDLCDELGLLIWQDFPYACSYYPDDDAACAVARREASAAVQRLRHHPSLALWCGNNENQMMRDGGWDGAVHHPERYHGERIYAGVLPQVISELDPERPYIASSPFGKVTANSGADGDQHYWDVWHGRGDWKHYADSDARFCSEFGFASAPGREVWKTIAPGFELLNAEPRHPVARWHDKTAKGYETFIGLVELHYPRSRTLEQWCYFSQLNQRDALRFGIEHYRRSAFCRGALIWQLNDCWPVQSWAIIDSAFRYKAAAYDLRRLYAPLLASLERDGDTLRWWAILDNAIEPCAGSFVLEVRCLSDGRLLERRHVDTELAAGERRLLESLALASFDPRDTIIVSQLAGRSSFLLLCEPKELSLEARDLVVRPADGGLVVQTNGPVVDLCFGDANGDCQFLDNFVTLGQAGRFRLRTCGEPGTLAARSLAGVHRIQWVE